VSHRAAQEEYSRRLGQREAEIARLGRLDRRLGNARVAVFLVAAAMAWPALISRAWHAGWLALPVAAFLALVAVHGPVVSAVARRRLAAAFYRRGLARLAGEWSDPLDEGAGYRDEEHPYAEDLDLFGRGSVYALLCTAHSLAGRQTLAAWLSAPATPQQIAGRQDAVSELRQRLDLREELAILAADLSPEIRSEALDSWGRAPAKLGGSVVPVAAGVLGAINLAALGVWLLGPLAGRFVLPGLALAAVLALAVRARVTAVLAGLAVPAGELRFLAGLLIRIEQESFTSPRLQELQRRSAGAAARPSARLLELARLIEWSDSRGNLFFQPIAGLLLLGTHFAFAAERWRARHGDAIGGWLGAIGEFEALSSLAAFAYENPGYVFPEVLEGPPRLDGESLVHPLLPRAAAVANSVSLGGDGPRLLLVSGSNMSGKSTLLRTVGVATVLALAGAPVPASRLRLTPLRVGASIRLHDSLLEGVSRFYAELQRLQQIGELAASGPTLFLLDEILHGTNSHDRRLGAAGLIRGLLDAEAVGLVTTHDLALAEIADELAPAAVNVHFEDHLEQGRMAFDYRLRPGTVERGNALALMRSLGLPVEEG
jgi:hypothetical protein